ncbi:hypothetical protein SAMN02745206_03592 [Desulfacinum infernum DSM 9756]|jgi:hypothetical protein|uniref:Uncharacterized protein n=1 Tax=Desulfacinum infernum DSM 9756 TaxID=1121391 RepID=A0A1M5IGC5_9BACT|nr:hypothetical protein [Desulfacinum infernum]SHG27341.1 hypothetical protein SAMN02745206_03592 [Desulfacinum infernum DSM 9756]
MGRNAQRILKQLQRIASVSLDDQGHLRILPKEGLSSRDQQFLDEKLIELQYNPELRDGLAAELSSGHIGAAATPDHSPQPPSRLSETPSRPPEGTTSPLPSPAPAAVPSSFRLLDGFRVEANEIVLYDREKLAEMNSWLAHKEYALGARLYQYFLDKAFLEPREGRAFKIRRGREVFWVFAGLSMANLNRGIGSIHCPVYYVGEDRYEKVFDPRQRRQATDTADKEFRSQQTQTEPDYLYPENSDHPHTFPIPMGAKAKVDAIRDEALEKGWTEHALYSNRGTYPFPYGNDYGLICYLDERTRIEAIHSDHIKIRRNQTTFRFANPDAEQPWKRRIKDWAPPREPRLEMSP